MWETNRILTLPISMNCRNAMNPRITERDRVTIRSISIHLVAVPSSIYELRGIIKYSCVKFSSLWDKFIHFNISYFYVGSEKPVCGDNCWVVTCQLIIISGTVSILLMSIGEDITQPIRSAPILHSLSSLLLVSSSD